MVTTAREERGVREWRVPGQIIKKKAKTTEGCSRWGGAHRTGTRGPTLVILVVVEEQGEVGRENTRRVGIGGADIERELVTRKPEKGQGRVGTAPGSSTSTGGKEVLGRLKAEGVTK